MPSSPDTPNGAAGLTSGAAAHLLWGILPGFWLLLAPAGALEILAHQVVWTLAVMALVTLVLRRGTALLTLPPRAWLLAAAGAALIATTWGTFLYGVTTNQVVETSLGYFITPLAGVLAAVMVCNETATRLQWTAVLIGGAAICVLTIESGDVPVLALLLATGFSLYGLLRKHVPLTAEEGLTLETIVLAVPAAGVLVWLGVSGQATFGTGTGHSLLLAASGLAIALPVLLVGYSAPRVRPLTGELLSYLTPVLMLALGVLVLAERPAPGAWACFALVALALGVYTADAVLATRPETAERVANVPGQWWAVLRSRAKPAPQQVTVGSEH